MSEDKDKKGSFAEVLKEIDGGAAISELTIEMAELVQAVGAYGKAGFLTLKIKLTPKGGQNLISYDITTKKPTVDRGVTVMFATKDGGLTKRDPRQPVLPGAIVDIKREA